MSKCDWEIIEGDEAELDDVEYMHYICSQCGAVCWNYEYPEDCYEKDN